VSKNLSPFSIDKRYAKNCNDAANYRNYAWYLSQPNPGYDYGKERGNGKKARED
jgi:hypothetical protein